MNVLLTAYSYTAYSDIAYSDISMPVNFETASSWRLTNLYFVLRHGESVANQQGIIISSPHVGIDGYGLTDRGVESVRDTMRESAKSLEGIRAIYTSDFSRARETAEIAGEILEVDVRPTDDLRERFFGSWDQTSITNYQRVWNRDRDSNDPADLQGDSRVESVAAVATRMTHVIERAERAHSGDTILLVSHGDPLQILIAAFNGVDIRQHRSIAPLQPAELRSLRSGPR